MDIAWETPGIVLKQYLDESDVLRLRELEAICTERDRIALKLELDYKLAYAKTRNHKNAADPISEYLYFQAGNLVGYLGVCAFGGPNWEVSGMVHPNWRRQGIYRALYRQFLNEMEYRKPEGVLLLCDRASQCGRAFIESTGAIPEHSEHELFLSQAPEKGLTHNSMKLRRANNSDAAEIHRQNQIFFHFGEEMVQSGEGASRDRPDAVMPEEEEKRGMTIYLAEINGLSVGKVHIQRGREVWGIYGLGILPEYRGKGYGRELLSLAVNQMEKEGAPAVMLQVDTDNDRALGLYRSCGFRETSVMDYYKL